MGEFRERNAATIGLARLEGVRGNDHRGGSIWQEARHADIWSAEFALAFVAADFDIDAIDSGRARECGEAQREVLCDIHGGQFRKTHETRHGNLRWIADWHCDRAAAGAGERESIIPGWEGC